jgi:hypothetical protein
MDRGAISKYTIVFLNDRSIACSWYIENRKKATFMIVLFPIQNIPDEAHYLSRKQMGSALTKTEIGISLLIVQVEMARKC